MSAAAMVLRARRDSHRARHRGALFDQEREAHRGLARAAAGEQEERVEAALRAFREQPARPRLIDRCTEVTCREAGGVPRHEALDDDRRGRQRVDHRRDVHVFETGNRVLVNGRARQRRQRARLLDRGGVFAQIPDRHRHRGAVGIEDCIAGREERAGGACRQDGVRTVVHAQRKQLTASNRTTRHRSDRQERVARGRKPAVRPHQVASIFRRQTTPTRRAPRRCRSASRCGRWRPSWWRVAAACHPGWRSQTCPEPSEPRRKNVTRPLATAHSLPPGFAEHDFGPAGRAQDDRGRARRRRGTLQNTTLTPSVSG